MTQVAVARPRADILLVGGQAAGPLYIAVVVIQMLSRDGYDISRHPASMLSNGEHGWIQIANFTVSGLLFLASAVGLRRSLRRAGGRGATWGPRLVGVFGAGMLGAAIFSADPADGFPVGTPTGPPTTMSWHAAMHVLVAGPGFVALIAACFVFARWFSAVDDRGWAVFSRVTGTLFLGTWILTFALMGSRPANVAFALGIALAMIWASLLAGRAKHG